MPEFGDVKQVRLPDQAKLPGEETRFFKEGSSGKSGDWISELGNAAGNFLEQGVQDILKAPVDIVSGAAKSIGDGLSSAAKGIYQGLKEAVQEIKQDIREAKSSPREPAARREPAAQKDGQREAKSTPSHSQSARSATENKQEHQARNEPHAKTHEAAKPRERDSNQSSPQKHSPSSAMVRAESESAKDVAARTASVPAHQVAKEVHAPTVRQNHAPAPSSPNQEKTGADPSLKVSSEKVAEAMIKKSVESILKDIRAGKEISKEKTQENVKAPDKSPERTR